LDLRQRQLGRPSGLGTPRRQGRSLVLPILVLGALVVVCLVSFLVLPTILKEMNKPAPREVQVIPGIGKRVSYVQLEPLTGKGETVTLRSLAGSVAIVNFWGTWCGPCRTEFPELVELGKQLAPHRDVRLLLVSCGPDGPEDFGELKAETEAYLKSFQNEVPTYWDPDHKTAAAFSHVSRMQVFPTTFVLDREGIIRGVWPGYHPRAVAEMRQLVSRLLNEDSAEAKKAK
jgi:cytochrome c biogenesis protein CcmG, thiol:disulfide interchange protein DsbE